MSPEIEITDFITIADRAAALGCNVPTGIALLPRNFDTAAKKDELMHENSAPTVRTLWRQAGIVETRLEAEGERFPQISEHGFVEWIGPTILVTSAWLSHNPEILAVALGVISNYLTDIFKGVPDNPKVRLDIVVQRENGAYRKVRYKGSVDGMKELPSIIQKAVSDD